MYGFFASDPEMIREHRGREHTRHINDIHKTNGQRFSAVTSMLVDDQWNGLLPA